MGSLVHDTCMRFSLGRKKQFECMYAENVSGRVEGQLLYERSVIVDGMVRLSYLIGPLCSYACMLPEDY